MSDASSIVSGAARPHISVVVPARNEAPNIAPLVEEIVRAFAAAPIEIIYVNDGSQDGTEAELRGLMKKYGFLRLIRHEVSCGQSAAVRNGVAAARAAVVVTLDGDGQNDPAFLPSLVAALERDPAVGLVAGQRVGRKATGFKRLQSRIANTARKSVLRDGTRDTGCGLKAFRRERLFEVARACRIDRDLFASEFVIRAGRMGRAIREIPIALREKRPPSVRLLRRIPRVLKGLVELGWAIRGPGSAQKSR